MRTLNSLMSLKGRTALVTGACGFLGKAICETLIEQECHLILLDLPESNFSEITQTIPSHSKINVTSIEVDLEQETSRDAAIKKILRDTDSLNILINTAALVSANAIEGWATDFKNQSIDTWDRAISINLSSVFHLTRDLAPRLRISGNGSIINIGSIYGVAAPDYSLYAGTNMSNPAAYAASKGGLIQLTKWLSTTLAKEIRVNSISPGGIFRDQPKEFVSKYEIKTPLGRMATEEDFKGIIAYLSSDLSAYVTGQNILVDGGWTV
ncbi:SDR family oxidoreductase [bacterium]|nr:SDR family oxidoreductase [Gammaproteobacteria bacterium]MDB0028576.1 SDR family oxidoreductase [bacterium]